jgi:pimeloyl-ACP methyl ester carboxylesterase
VDRLAVRDAVLAVDQTGAGDTDLVLVHGFQNDRTAWDPFVARCDPARFRITRFDLVGCSGRAPPEPAEARAARAVRWCSAR